MLEFFKTSTFKTILFWDRILCLSSFLMSTVAGEAWAIPPIPNLTKRKEV